MGQCLHGLRLRLLVKPALNLWVVFPAIHEIDAILPNPHVPALCLDKLFNVFRQIDVVDDTALPRHPVPRLDVQINADLLDEGVEKIRAAVAFGFKLILFALKGRQHRNGNEHSAVAVDVLLERVVFARAEAQVAEKGGIGPVAQGRVSVEYRVSERLADRSFFWVHIYLSENQSRLSLGGRVGPSPGLVRPQNP